VLEERARALSAAPPPEDTGERMQIVPFVVDGEAYGVNVLQVQEVHPLRGLVAVPSTPGFVAGVLNIRGTIYSVVHLRRFFGLPAAGAGTPTRVLVVGAAGLTLGILADDVADVCRVAVRDIGAPSSVSGIPEQYLFGVTPAMVVVLNLDAVLADTRMVVAAEDAG
jgi:purine-binding chemotaxis protein CheW